MKYSFLSFFYPHLIFSTFHIPETYTEDYW